MNTTTQTTARTTTIIVKAPAHEVQEALSAPGLRPMIRGVLPNLNFSTTDVVTDTDSLGRRLICKALRENNMEYGLLP